MSLCKENDHSEIVGMQSKHTKLKPGKEVHSSPGVL